MKKPTPKIYRMTNWFRYNKALISREDTTFWFDCNITRYDESKGKQGSNLFRYGDSILFNDESSISLNSTNDHKIYSEPH